MRKFTCVADIGDLAAAVAEALEVKRDRFAYQHLGRNKTLLMIFFNSSLRTRLSTQKAAMNLGMNVMVLDVNQGAWKLETERGVVMDGDKAEHLLEAIPVMGSYCDLIGVRSVRPLSGQDGGLRGARARTVHPLLGPSGLLDGGRHAPPVAELRRSDHHRGAQAHGASRSR